MKKISRRRKGMSLRDFLRVCEKSGCKVERKLPHPRGSEYRVIFPDGFHYVGTRTNKTVCRMAMSRARRNGIPVDSAAKKGQME